MKRIKKWLSKQLIRLAYFIHSPEVSDRKLVENEAKKISKSAVILYNTNDKMKFSFAFLMHKKVFKERDYMRYAKIADRVMKRHG